MKWAGLLLRASCHSRLSVFNVQKTFGRLGLIGVVTGHLRIRVQLGRLYAVRCVSGCLYTDFELRYRPSKGWTKAVRVKSLANESCLGTGEVGGAADDVD